MHRNNGIAYLSANNYNGASSPGIAAAEIHYQLEGPRTCLPRTAATNR
jgi:hypothetical protein